eukprot:638392-Pyramimonas_sp.AAC.1
MDATLGFLISSSGLSRVSSLENAPDPFRFRLRDSACPGSGAMAASDAAGAASPATSQLLDATAGPRAGPGAGAPAAGAGAATAASGAARSFSNFSRR